jgi:hypothetical protein
MKTLSKLGALLVLHYMSLHNQPLLKLRAVSPPSRPRNRDLNLSFVGRIIRAVNILCIAARGEEHSTVEGEGGGVFRNRALASDLCWTNLQFWHSFYIFFKTRGFVWIFLTHFILHCFICLPSDYTVSEDAGIEPRTVATLALAVRRSNLSARSRLL